MRMGLVWTLPNRVILLCIQNGIWGRCGYGWSKRTFVFQPIENQTTSQRKWMDNRGEGNKKGQETSEGLETRKARSLCSMKMYVPLVWSWYSSLAGNVFHVLLEHAARACLQGFSGWLVFSIYGFKELFVSSRSRSPSWRLFHFISMAEKTATSLTIESSSTPKLMLYLKTLPQIQSWSMKSFRFLKAIWPRSCKRKGSSLNKVRSLIKKPRTLSIKATENSSRWMRGWTIY